MLMLLVAAVAICQDRGDLPRSPQPLPRYGFQQLTIDDGLPESFVRNLMQDSRGYMWIATQNGLVRYDGRDMKVYRPSPSAGQLQIVSTIFEDKLGHVWAGSGLGEFGLARMDPSTETWSFYRHDPDDANTLSGSKIVEAAEASDGSILVVSFVDSLGLCVDRLGAATGPVTRFRRPVGSKRTGCYDVFNVGPGTPLMVRDADGRSWIRTGNGLLEYRPNADSLIHHRSVYGRLYPSGRLDALGETDRLGAVVDIHDSEDRTEPFELDADGRVLVVALGEMIAPLKADYGWIESAAGDTVWAMDANATEWAGGDEKNRIAVAVASLPAGGYRLRYRSDDTHSHAQWHSTAPDRADFYGIQVFSLGDSKPPVPLTKPNETEGDLLPSGLVTTLYADSGERLWVGTFHGLCRFDRRLGGCADLFRYDAGDPMSLPGDSVFSITEDHRGRLWVGTRQGFARLQSPQSGHFVTYEIPDETVQDRQAPATVRSSRQNTILEMEPDDDALWLRSIMNVVRFEPDLERFTLYEHDPRDPSSITSNRPTLLKRDRQGEMWIGTHGGLNRLDKTAGLFERVRREQAVADDTRGDAVFGFAQTPDGRVWVGASTGFDRLDLATLSRSPEPEWPSTRDTAGPLLVDDAGRIWLNKYERSAGRIVTKVVRFTPGRGIDLTLDVNSSDSTAIPAQPSAMVQDHQGRIWAGTESQGVVRLDPETGRVTRLPFKPGPPRDELEGALDDRRVISMHVDRSGTVWAGTNLGGLNRLDPESETFTSYYQDGGFYAVTAIYEDREGRFWVGTYLEGLLLFDREEGRVVARYDENNLFPNNSVYTIAEDEAGLLWLSTGRGIVRFDPDARIARTFGRADGLESVEFRRGGFRARSGIMLFPNNDGGFTAFDPSLLAPTEQPALATVDRFGIRDDHGDEHFVSLIGGRIPPLDAHQNDLAFQFNGLEYARPNAVSFRYRLRGYEDDWVDEASIRTARYTNLSPGSYTFEVMASSADGIWSESRTLAFVISPPWWRTWWAYVVYGLMLAGGIVAVDRLQRRRLVQRERERTRERELEQARELRKAHQALEDSFRDLKAAQNQLIQQEKLASLGQLTAGIAHEIKNPLNFVNNFSDLSAELLDEVREELDALDGKVDADRIGLIRDILGDVEMNVSKIAEHGRRADGIVRSMLDHSRGNKGERQVTDVNALVEEYVNLAFHGTRAQKADFNVNIQRSYGDDVGRVEMVPQEVGRVILNLCNNAFHAVHERALGSRGPGAAGDAPEADAYEPRVRVSTHRNGDTVEIAIEDNGPGIPEKIRQKIFEPFFTTKPTGDGTGLGLSLSYDIITQGHGGSMAVESEPGEGARFSVRLPVAAQSS